MERIIRGRVYLVGRNIDTDIIYPGRYLELTDPAEIGKHCFAGLDEEYSARFEKGGIIVAGPNFGCGSSREHAAIALVSMGAGCVIADSFARIFFRNGINLGLPLIVCKGISEIAEDGQHLAVDIGKGLAFIEETGERLECESLGEKAIEILSAGGIKPLMRARFASHGQD